ncbi:hypothetical protein BGZ61DRAFT_439413 [Ilyonectria robusta]|uniref:uncharacterized protein n=1 Tax=Ilyonectria robusta TaxID=1079257 RepID=UPI001E8EE64F|nr:uncharacterized protein BGZ61DRAFT_439413 [Ilyonectria robusta]KAH8738005.1 hypothetical protein BGZ61DRAFT_439413 [Ilyonectria robusta]
MRFFALIAVFLGSSTVLAAPANAKRDSSCCCCDISEPAVVCKKMDDCLCLDVYCPDDAPTIWANTVGPPEATEGPVKRRDDCENDDQGHGFDCCCCDPSIPATVCDFRASPEDCVCLAVECPEGAPTIRSGDPLPTKTPVHTPTPTPATPEPCCCCNIGLGSIVCELRTAVDEGCFCPLVICPDGAPTITVEASQPEKTE